MCLCGQGNVRPLSFGPALRRRPGNPRGCAVPFRLLSGYASELYRDNQMRKVFVPPQFSFYHTASVRGRPSPLTSYLASLSFGLSPWSLGCKLHARYALSVRFVNPGSPCTPTSRMLTLPITMGPSVSGLRFFCSPIHGVHQSPHPGARSWLTGFADFCNERAPEPCPGEG